MANFKLIEHAHFYTMQENGILKHCKAVEIPYFVRKKLGDRL